MSLRARLVAGLVALSALGLLLLSAIVYAEQRSFLHDRVDLQAAEALPAVDRVLEDRGPGPRPGPGGGRGGRDEGPGRLFLPPGTYGGRLGPDGEVLASFVVTYGLERPPAPVLPESLEPGDAETVPARGDSDLRYRVVAGGRFGVLTTVAAVPLTEVDATLDRLLLVLGLVVAGVLAALGALSWGVVRIGLRPLERMSETAGAIAGGDLSRRVQPATEQTEVGRLGISLNAMLDRLESAFSAREASERRLRQFIADASHELRTPLSSIRGYAELFRLGAASSPGDIEKSMRRIEDETARMGGLVEDLLTLARVDEVREPVRERVDLFELSADAVRDARVAAPERTVTLRGEPVTISGDPDRLRQVLGNLLRNALVHTPAGTPVEVTVETDGQAAALEVRDHGPGLPEGAAQALFERFWRAERGRGRGPAGAGLGLAIVAGIVRAHGGEVVARDAEGGGACFRVTLPAAAAQQKGEAMRETARS